MLVIGVTGGVGTGKSTVARLFARHGANVLDADRIAHELMRPGAAVWRKIRSHFGDSVLTPSREINRRKVGELVFKEPKRLRALAGIIHPAVRRRIRGALKEIRRRNPDAVAVLDVPLLIEAGGAYPLDALVVVSAPMKVVARRLKARSGWDPAEIRRRQKFQRPLREKERMADFIVRNQGSPAATRRQVDRIWKQLSNEAQTYVAKRR